LDFLKGKAERREFARGCPFANQILEERNVELSAIDISWDVETAN
jgi:hypothetical protein